jgi:excisionase family DNA binding protein
VLDFETDRNSKKAAHPEQARLAAGNELSVRQLHPRSEDDPANASRSLPEQLEKMAHALTAKNLAQLLQVSEVTIYKLAKAHKLPSFRIGTAVRFDPRAVAQWLRQT